MSMFHVREPLNKSGRIELRIRMIKAWNARNSRSIAKFHNAEIDCSGLKSIGHDLFRFLSAGNAASILTGVELFSTMKRK
jgi:hypothetical protein